MTAAHHAGGRSFDRRTDHRRRSGTDQPVRTASAVVGVTFLLVGIAGFVPGLTSNYDALDGAGTESQAELLGLFQVSVLHNVVHLAFGVLGLLAARAAASAKLFLIGGGVLYLGLTLYGALIDMASDANFLPLNNADNWLHLALGVGMIAIGLATAAADHRPTERRR